MESVASKGFSSSNSSIKSSSKLRRLIDVRFFRLDFESSLLIRRCFMGLKNWARWIASLTYFKPLSLLRFRSETWLICFSRTIILLSSCSMSALVISPKGCTCSLGANAAYCSGVLKKQSLLSRLASLADAAWNIKILFFNLKY